MEPAVKQGLVLGAVVGAFLGAALYALSGHAYWFLLIPFTALMGAAPQWLKPKVMEEDD